MNHLLVLLTSSSSYNFCLTQLVNQLSSVGIVESRDNSANLMNQLTVLLLSGSSNRTVILRC